MKHPIKLGGEAELVGLHEILAKVFEGILVIVIDCECLPQVHDVVNRLQLRHVTRQHERKQVNDQMRVATYYHVGLFANSLKIVKLRCLNRIGMSFIDKI